MSEQLKKNDYVIFLNQGKIYQVAEDEQDGKLKLNNFGESLFLASDFSRVDLGVVG